MWRSRTHGRTWCAWCNSSILSCRIWQSYSRLFLSICLLSFSTAVRSSSRWSSSRGSPYLITYKTFIRDALHWGVIPFFFFYVMLCWAQITLSCCKALYNVASNSWIRCLKRKKNEPVARDKGRYVFFFLSVITKSDLILFCDLCKGLARIIINGVFWGFFRSLDTETHLHNTFRGAFQF